MSIIKSQATWRKRQPGRGELRLLVWAFVLSATLGVVGRSPVAQAAVFNIPSGDVAALITAITTANTNGQNDTIHLAAGTYTLTALHNDTDGPNGLPSITSRMTIKGAGAARTIITRASNAVPFRLVHVAPSGRLTLEGVTLSQGLLTSGGGGGLFNAGTLTLIRSTVRDNVICDLADNCIPTGTGPGGGIAKPGTLTLVESMVSNNFASSGGGIDSSGTLTLTRSTVNDNYTDDSAGGGTCGGISTRGTATLTSSTVSGNGSSVGGGGICNPGTLTLRHSTVVDNFVPDGDGGGIYNAGTLSMRNSIIAGNTTCAEGAPPGVCPSSDDCLNDETLTSLGRNLVGTGCPGNGSGDRVVTLDQVFTTVLGPLRDNGGPTLTHALLPGSPAIDAGPPTCTTPDQRGVVRPQDGDSNGTVTCDIGAVEFSATVWNDYPFAAQDGTFSVFFDAVPHQNRMNGVTGLAHGSVHEVQDLAVIVRFNSAGTIDARNGNSYAADRVIPYTAGTRYYFRLEVNVWQHTYSVYVRPEGSTEQRLATDFAFRTEQQAVGALNTWALYAGQGSHTIGAFFVQYAVVEPL